MSYFPNDLQPASVAWEVGQKVSPVHLYEMESHLRSMALLPPIATAPSAGLVRMPPEHPSADVKVHCDLISDVRRVVHLTVNRCTGLTHSRQWIFVTEPFQASTPVEQVEGRWPDVYFSLHRLGDETKVEREGAPEGCHEPAVLGRDSHRLVRQPTYEVKFTNHEPMTQKDFPTPGPDGLVAGRLIDRNGTYELDEWFCPPSLFIRDVPAWTRKVGDIRQAILYCADEVRGYFATGLEFDPLKKKSHVLHQLGLLLSQIRGLGRNPWEHTLSLIESYYQAFSAFSAFLYMHQAYLKSLDEDGTLMELVGYVQQVAGWMEHHAPGQALFNVYPLLDSIHRSFPVIQQIAGRVRQALEQDRRTPPDNHFIWKEPFFQLRHFSTVSFQRSLSGRVQLDLPRNSLPGRVKFLRAVAVLFYFQPIRLKDAYNTGDPDIRWRMNESEPWRTNGVLLRENPLREVANSVGYVGLLMNLNDVNVNLDESLVQLQVWLPGEDVPREARCYAHYDEPPPEAPKPEKSTPAPAIPPSSDQMW